MSVLSRIRTIVLGRELSASEAASEQITPVEGLSALSLDALTSVAYGPEAILIVLAAAGASALHLILPDHHRHRRAPGHPGDLVPAGDRRLPARRRRLRGVPRQLRATGQQARGCGTHRRLHPDGGGVDRGRCRAAHVRLPVDHPLHGPDVPRASWLVITALNLRGLGESARAFLLPTLVFIVGLARHHRRGPRSPARSRTPRRPAPRWSPPIRSRRSASSSCSRPSPRGAAR